MGGARETGELVLWCGRGRREEGGSGGGEGVYLRLGGVEGGGCNGDVVLRGVERGDGIEGLLVTVCWLLVGRLT